MFTIRWTYYGVLTHCYCDRNNGFPNKPNGMRGTWRSSRAMRGGRVRSGAGGIRLAGLGCSGSGRRAGARNYVSRRGARSTPDAPAFHKYVGSYLALCYTRQLSRMQALDAAKQWIFIKSASGARVRGLCFGEDLISTAPAVLFNFRYRHIVHNVSHSKFKMQ